MTRACRLALAAALLLAGQTPLPANSAARGSTITDCPDCTPLVVVPAGRFMMGSDDGEASRPEGPIHEVRIARPFALGQTEVTVAQFRRFVDATGYQVAPGCRVQEREIGERGRIEWKDDPQASWREPRTVSPVEEHWPVVCVGRIDALAFTAWLAKQTGKPYRLPSESEWEYAARAGSPGIYFWGNNSDLGCEHANLYDRAGRRLLDFGWGFADCDDGFPELAPVGRFKANAFGLHDMIGNVWEWTQDCYVPIYDTTGPRDGRAVLGDSSCALWSVRGGGWMTRPSRQRIAFRGRDPNDARYSYFGFRVARDLDARELRQARRR